jgi:uncharacterized protein YjlB
LARPSARDLDAALRPRKAKAFLFKDDGIIPNNPNLPLVLYRSPSGLRANSTRRVCSKSFSSATAGAIAGGMAFTITRIIITCAAVRAETRVRLGGAKGRGLKLNAGDVVILPAGTGHERPGSADLLVIGAYPPSTRIMSAAHRAKGTSMTARARPFPRSRFPEKTRCMEGMVR